MTDGENAKQTADKIAGLVEDAVILDSSDSSDSPVKKKLRREIEEALVNNERKDRKKRSIRVLQNMELTKVSKLVENGDTY